MKVSVVQPVFNGEKYLYDSVFSVLGQTFTDFEYIIVNDGSTDKTSEILDWFATIDNRIIVINSNNNRGYIEALCTGIENSKGEYIFRMDSDDKISPTTLFSRFSHIHQSENIVLVSGKCIHFFDHKNTNRKLILPNSSVVLSWLLIWGNPITHTSSIFRKSDYSGYGGYKNIKNLEDWDLWCQLKEKGIVVLQDNNDVFYRIHENQSTKQNANDLAFLSNVIKILNSNLKNLNINTSNLNDRIIAATFYDSSFGKITGCEAKVARDLILEALKSFRLINNITELEMKEAHFFIFIHLIKISFKISGKIEQLKYLFGIPRVFIKSFFSYKQGLHYSISVFTSKLLS